MTETNGTWGTAQHVAKNFSTALILTLSCAAPGNCAAGGWYHGGAKFSAFVMSEANGTWGKAEEVPGTATLNTGGHAQVSSMSCPAAGKCSAGGYYTTTTTTVYVPLVVSES